MPRPSQFEAKSGGLGSHEGVLSRYVVRTQSSAAKRLQSPALSVGRHGLSAETRCWQALVRADVGCDPHVMVRVSTTLTPISGVSRRTTQEPDVNAPMLLYICSRPGVKLAHGGTAASPPLPRTILICACCVLTARSEVHMLCVRHTQLSALAAVHSPTQHTQAARLNEAAVAAGLSTTTLTESSTRQQTTRHSETPLCKAPGLDETTSCKACAVEELYGGNTVLQVSDCGQPTTSPVLETKRAENTGRGIRQPTSALQA